MVTAVPGFVTWVAFARPGVVVLNEMKPVGVTLQVALPVRFLLLPSSKEPVASNCTESPTAGRVFDCRVETLMPCRTGSTKNPWQPTATAIRRRIPNEPKICSFRRVLTIDTQPLRRPFPGRIRHRTQSKL